MFDAQKTKTLAKLTFFIVLGFSFYFSAFTSSGRMQSNVETDGLHLLLAPQSVTVTNGQAATGVLGQPDFTSNAPGTSSSIFNQPTQAVVDPTSGKVFVVEFANNRVLRFSSAAAATNGGAAEAVLGQPNFTTSTAATTQTGMYNPEGAAVDSAGRLWIADSSNTRVLRFDNAATKSNGAPADAVLGQPGFTTSTLAATQSGMNVPIGVIVDSAGRLWVADSGNNRVLRFDNAAGKVNGAPADIVLGQPDFTSNANRAAQSGMNFPIGIVIDSGGRLWVADAYNNRVLRFDNAASKGSGANADAVLGQPDFSTVTPSTTQNRMNLPAGVTTDSRARLYVADSSNNRVLIFNNASTLTNGANASDVLGQTNFTTGMANNGGVSASSLNAPFLLFFDESTQNLSVADTYNNRVLSYSDSSTTPNTPTGSSVTVTSGNASVIFAQVTNAGNTTFTPISPNSAGSPPSGYTIKTDAPAYDITTTAAYTPPVVVCFTDSSITTQAEFSRARILHSENGQLVDRTILAPDNPAPDFATRKVCARVNSLSPFVTALAPAAPTSCTQPPPNMVGWYPGDGNSNDISSVNNNGTLIGGATYAAGKVGQAFTLNGTDAYVQAPANAAQDPTTAGSMDAWVMLNQLPSTAGHVMTIIGKGGPNTDFDLQAESDNRFHFYIANGNTVVSTTTAQTGVWYHVAGTWDSTGLRIYVNGVLENTNGIQNLTRGQSAQPLDIGNSEYFGPRFFSGLIDEAEVFNRALTQTEIQAIVNADSAGKCKATPTAATVSIGGRVQTAAGRGIPNAIVSLTDSGGNLRTAATDSSGYYSFADVPAGDTYVFSVKAKHYHFAQPSQVLSVNDEQTSVNFTAFLEGKLR